MNAYETLTSYLPPSEGLLPKWLFFIAVVSIGNSVQSYISLAGTREVYAGPATPTQLSSSSSSSPSRNRASKISNSPVTELSARTFGTWTALSSIVRLYAAYNIHDARLYELAFWTYGIAVVHFACEWLVFKTARWGRGLAGPVFVAVGTSTWMWMQWNYYIR